MDNITLTRKIRLHPRASLLKGEFFERKKLGGAFSAVIPHYATSGVPVVQFEADTNEPINIQSHGAEIELNFRENDPNIQSINARHFSNYILVQLMYGKKGEGASKAACRALREASTCFTKLIDSGQELYLAGLFVLKVSGGSSDGLLVPLGVFTLDGATIWLNPEAVELGLLSVQFPKIQVEQNSKDEIHWYDRIYANLKHLFQDDELHDRILESRAGALLETGKVKTKESGLALANKEARALKAKVVKKLKAKVVAEVLPIAEVLPEKKVKRSCKATSVKKDTKLSNKTTSIKKDTKLSNKATSEVEKLPPKRRLRTKNTKSD